MGTPLFTPLESCSSKGGGQNIFFILFKVYGIQNDRTDQTEIMKKDRYVDGAEKLTQNHQNLSN